MIDIPSGMCCPTIDDLIDSTYAGVDSVPPPPPDYFLHRCILSPRNEDVNDVNNQVLDRFLGEERTYLSADSVVVEAGADDDNSDNQPFPVEFLRTLNASGLPLGDLRLKIGCPIICFET